MIDNKSHVEIGIEVDNTSKVIGSKLFGEHTFVKRESVIDNSFVEDSTFDKSTLKDGRGATTCSSFSQSQAEDSDICRSRLYDVSFCSGKLERSIIHSGEYNRSDIIASYVKASGKVNYAFIIGATICCRYPLKLGDHFGGGVHCGRNIHDMENTVPGREPGRVFIPSSGNSESGSGLPSFNLVDYKDASTQTIGMDKDFACTTSQTDELGNLTPTASAATPTPDVAGTPSTSAFMDPMARPNDD